MVPSLFIEDDRRFKLSVNTSTGLWRCFVSKRAGNFYQLVSLLEGIDPRQAEVKCTLASFSYSNCPKPTIISKLESSLEDYLSSEKLVPCVNSKVARNYLESRGLLGRARKENWQISKRGKYAGRIIIPYYKEDTLIFFQARSTGSEFPKYLTPPSDVFIKSSSVLYPFDWEEEYVVVVEGPLDAISLQEMGINATAIQGSYCSTVQLQQLKDFGGKIIMSFDDDEAGVEGMNKMDSLRKKLCMDPLYTLSTPKPFHDWNDVLASKKANSESRTDLCMVSELDRVKNYGMLETLSEILDDFES